MSQAARIRVRTLIVVPCYNEARRLDGPAFLAALRAEPNLEFVVVDDGSTDTTLECLKRLEADAAGRVHVVALRQNRGKAEAVRHGVLSAFARGATVVGYWDADLATPLGAIAEMWEALADPHILLVLGARVKLMGRHIQRDLRRHLIGRGFATAASVALGLPVYDTQCGAKLFRAHPAIVRAFERPFEHVWTFDVELLARLLRDEARTGEIHLSEQCVEFPLAAWHDQPGSKLRASHVPRIAWEVLRLLYHSPRWSHSVE